MLCKRPQTLACCQQRHQVMGHSQPQQLTLCRVCSSSSSPKLPTHPTAVHPSTGPLSTPVRICTRAHLLLVWCWPQAQLITNCQLQQPVYPCECLHCCSAFVNFSFFPVHSSNCWRLLQHLYACNNWQSDPLSTGPAAAVQMEPMVL